MFIKTENGCQESLNFCALRLLSKGGDSLKLKLNNMRSGTFQLIQSIDVKKYDYPFQEWIDILKVFEYQPYDQRIICNVLDSFKQKIFNEQNIPLYELGYFRMTFSVNKHINGIRQPDTCKVDNLFTACIMYNLYIPYTMLREGQTSVEVFGNKVFYDSSSDEFMLKLKGVDISIGSEASLIPEKRIEAYDQKQERIEMEWEKENPNVPFGSIKLEKGKAYKGSMDSGFKIKTINGEIWIIIDSSCYDIYETSNTNGSDYS